MRRAMINTIAVIHFLLITTGVHGGSSISHIGVTATVLPIVKYEIIHQEKNLLITEENIKIGYIDVPGAVIFSIKSNSKNGYVMTFFVRSGLLKEVEVFYDSVSSGIHDTQNEIFMPSEGMKQVVKELSFRLHLSDILMPGMYDWPVAFMIQAV